MVVLVQAYPYQRHKYALAMVVTCAFSSPALALLRSAKATGGRRIFRYCVCEDGRRMTGSTGAFIGRPR